MVTALYAGILTLIYIALSFHVVRNRFKHRVGIGTGGNQQMEQAMRVHANFAEYVPLILILMILVEYTWPQPIYVHTLGCATVLGRLLHAYGLAKSTMTSFGRFTGTILTMLVLLVAAILLIIPFVTA